MNIKLLFGALLFSTITATAQVATINENFSTFSGASLPQNNWTSNRPSPYALVSPNNFVQAYSSTDIVNPTYIITPELIIINGTQTLKFDSQISTGSFPGAAGTIQVGTVNSAGDASSFVAITTPVALQSTSQTYTYTIPATSAKFIAFKIQPSTIHSAFQIDNVIFAPTSTLAISDNLKPDNIIRFAVNTENTALQFVAKKDPKNIQVYSAAGQKVAEGKLNNQRFDISRLQTGIYYIAIQTAEGTITQSKFIKK
ncbi:T9SS type A sorting domain-containing protein [Chryseobacterium sp. T16E-39]|uniref:T9SS type A sorting domain-containing protein n=1 Tax=Chryseobacterium sp. T16E-39 TaxID=2015076 RepID=UPI0012F7CE7A|nr:T9SS type A sorting domain-containing protein [Chryseobacterium sp. T16E-39]